MKKRRISLILVLCMVTSMVTALPIWAATDNTCGNNLTWTLDNGTLTICGAGAMNNWSSSSDVPWYDSRSSIKAVVIQNGVTSIGGQVF